MADEHVIGLPVIFWNTTWSLYNVIAYDPANKQVVIVFSRNAITNMVVAGTVSEGTITFGPTLDLGDQGHYTDIVYDPVSEMFILATWDGYAALLLASGNAITNYGLSEFNSGDGTRVTRYPRICNTATGFVIVYADQGVYNRPRMTAGHVSGTSLVFGAEAIIEESSAYYSTCAYDSVSDRVLFLYTKTSDEYLIARVALVAGDTITLGSAVAINSTATTNHEIEYDPVSGKFLIYTKEDGGHWLRTMTVSGMGVSTTDPFFLDINASPTLMKDVTLASNPDDGFIWLSYADDDYGDSPAIRGVRITESGYDLVEQSYLQDNYDVREMVGVYDPDTQQMVFAMGDDQASNGKGISQVVTPGYIKSVFWTEFKGQREVIG